MATRDILDYLGNVVGQLELPDDTPEEVWQAKLAPYAVTPESAQEKFLNYTIKVRKQFCEDLLERFKKKNILDGINAMQGMWMHHMMRSYPVTFGGVNYTVDILNMAVSGDVEIACLALIYGATDDMSQPYHWISSERKAWLIGELKSFLGWA